MNQTAALTFARTEKLQLKRTPSATCAQKRATTASIPQADTLSAKIKRTHCHALKPVYPSHAAKRVNSVWSRQKVAQRRFNNE